MAIVFGESPRNSERYSLAVGEGLVIIESLRELFATVEAMPFEDLIIVAPDVDPDTAADIAERYRTMRPTLGVILLRRRLDVTTLNHAMRSGVREVVSADDTAALIGACKRSLAISRELRLGGDTSPGQDRGQIIIVFSAKGGCGKTTISTNLAEAISQRPDARVCLVDFDLQFGDVGVALQLKPERSISDAIRMEDKLDHHGVASMLMPYRPRFDVLLAPVNPADVEHITGDLAGRILSILQEEYDYIIVDSPPAFTEVVLRSFDQASAYVLLTTLDLPAIKNLKVTIDTLDALAMPRDKWHVVVNRSDTHVGLEVSDVEKAIGMGVTARIPSSNDVPASINMGVTLMSSKPKHAVSKAILELGRTVAPEWNESVPSAPTRLINRVLRGA